MPKHSRPATKKGSMATKTYISKKTIPHFSVGERRVAFHATTMGNSYFTTDDASLQRGIERHPWYKKKFMLFSVEGDSPKSVTVAEEAGGAKKQEELKEVHFDTLADAKNYLAQECGVTRCNIKRIEDAVSAGKANGILLTIGNQ